MSEDLRALSLADCLFRVPSDRTRVVVCLFELLAASVPRPIAASARVFVLTSNNVGIRMDDEYTATHSRY
jgi:hypothetical protein